MIALLAGAAACGSKGAKGTGGGGAGGFDWPAAAGPGVVTATAAPGGTISGKVTYAGPAPGRVGATPDCGGSVPDPTLVAGKDGALLDAVVWLEAAPGAQAGAPAGGAPAGEAQAGNVAITQRQCAYVPHVTVTRVGSTVTIGNDDTLLHNVHGYVGQDSWFNEATQAGASVKKTVEDKGILPLRCDVHPWMQGYVLGFDHPFYARVGEDGRFSFPAPPPGKYDLVVWHGKLGKKQLPVEIAAGSGLTVEAAFP